MPNVRCTVDDCLYWDKGNKCVAEEIWVTLDRLASTDMEVGQFETVQTEARSSSETCCHTYSPRSGGKGSKEE